MNDYTPPQEAPLVDPFGRRITYVRVSVTDRCDFRCVYCMSEDMNFLPKRDILSLEELDRLCSAFVRLGIAQAADHRRRAARPPQRDDAVPQPQAPPRQRRARRGHGDHQRLAARALRRRARRLRRQAHQRLARHARPRQVPHGHPLGRSRERDEGDRRRGRGGAEDQDQRRRAQGLQRRRGARAGRLGAWARLRPHLHRGHAARRDGSGPRATSSCR